MVPLSSEGQETFPSGDTLARDFFREILNMPVISLCNCPCKKEVHCQIYEIWCGAQ